MNSRELLAADSFKLTFALRVVLKRAMDEEWAPAAALLATVARNLLDHPGVERYSSLNATVVEKRVPIAAIFHWLRHGFVSRSPLPIM